MNKNLIQYVVHLEVNDTKCTLTGGNVPHWRWRFRQKDPSICCPRGRTSIACGLGGEAMACCKIEGVQEQSWFCLMPRTVSYGMSWKGMTDELSRGGHSLFQPNIYHHVSLISIISQGQDPRFPLGDAADPPGAPTNNVTKKLKLKKIKSGFWVWKWPQDFCHVL